MSNFDFEHENEDQINVSELVQQYEQSVEEIIRRFLIRKTMKPSWSIMRRKDNLNRP